MNSKTPDPVQVKLSQLYNLTTDQDSLTSLKIAQRNADIDRDTRKDSESVNTIAILTLLYLPATFVFNFPGTVFFLCRRWARIVSEVRIVLDIFRVSMYAYWIYGGGVVEMVEEEEQSCFVQYLSAN